MGVRKAVIWRGIICGRCGKQGGGYYRNAKTIAELKKAASDWEYRDDYGNTCPECRRELRKTRRRAKNNE